MEISQILWPLSIHIAHDATKSCTKKQNHWQSRLYIEFKAFTIINCASPERMAANTDHGCMMAKYPNYPISKKIFHRNISKAIFCRNNGFLMESHGLGTHKVQGFLKRPKNLRKPPHLFWHYWVNVKTSVRFFQILWPSDNVSTLRTKYVLKVQLRIPHICTPQFIWIICLNWPIIWDIFEKSPKHMPIVNGHR